METFKIRCVNSECCTSITVGRHYTARRAPGYADVFEVKIGDSWLLLRKDRFVLLNEDNFKHEEKQTMQKDWREYTFHVKHTAQIDRSQITEDLNWDTPLFIMEIEGSEKVEAFIADEVWEKAANSGKKRKPNGKDRWCDTKFERQLGKLVGDFGDMTMNMRDVPKLAKLIAKIKRAKWHDSQKRRVTVKRVKV